MTRHIIRIKVPRVDSSAGRLRSESSSPDLSGDEDAGYSGVEDISDSEDDELNVFAAEQTHITSHKRRRVATPSPPRPVPFNDSQEDENHDGDVDEDEDNADVDDSGDDNDSALYDSDQSDDYDEEGDIEGAFIDESDHDPAEEFAAFGAGPAAPERRVRFVGIPDSESDSDSTDTDSDIETEYLTDLFVDQDALDSSFRRAIEQDPEDLASDAIEWTPYDGHTGAVLFAEPPSDTDIPDESPLATPVRSHFGAVAGLSDSDTSSDDLDEYDSGGDTTDEDDDENPVRMQTPMRCPSPMDESESDVPLHKHYKSPRGTPRGGTFKLDGSNQKPICILNPNTRKMMIFTPEDSRHPGLSPEQFDSQIFSSLTTSNDISSFLKDSSNPTFLSQALATATDPVSTGKTSFSMAPPQSVPNDEMGLMLEDDDEDDADEDGLRMEDFFSFGGESSEDDDEDEDEDGDSDVEDTPMASPVVTANQLDAPPLTVDASGNFSSTEDSHLPGPTTQRAASKRLQDQSPSEASPTSSSSDNDMPMRRPSTPPPRQRRYSGMLPPSAADTASMKRKASAVINSATQMHKRQRSISDVQAMQI